MQQLVSWILATALATSVAAGEAFVVTTPGKPGTGGLVPTLSGSGPLTPRSLPNALHVADALPHAPAIVVLGLSELAAPFQGGVLGPAPDKLLLGLTVGADGALALPFVVPAELPSGFTLWAQVFLGDAAAFAGRSATNTLALEVQLPRAVFPGVRSTLGADARDLELGDLDGDGVLDALAVLPLADQLVVARGLSSGDFAAPVAASTGAGPRSLALGDVNGDGHLDAVTANFDADDVSLFLGAGDASFAPAQSLAVLTSPWQVELADLDGDGLLDLVVSRGASAPPFTPGRIAVSLGLGDGTFRLPAVTTLTAADPAEHFALADLNGDGDLDLVLAGSKGLVVRAGLGTGAFASGVLIDEPDDVGGLVLADLDADGAPDLLVPNADPGGVAVYFGAGDGSFATPPQHLASEQGITAVDAAVADVDGDGSPDLALARELHSVAFLRGSGARDFEAPRSLPFGDDQLEVAFATLPGDAHPSVLALGESDLGLGVFRPGPDGLPRASESAEPSVTASSLLHVADFDLDGRLDVVGTSDSATLWQALGTGDGAFGAPASVGTGMLPRGMTVADVDLDGRLDVLIGATIGVWVHLGADGGGFEPAQVLPVSGGASELAVAEMNGDGVPDLAVGVRFGDQVMLLHGVGDGTFTPAGVLGVGADPVSVDFEDVDLDGVLDLVVGHAGVFTDSVRIFPGLAGGGFGAPVIHVGGGRVRDLAFADLDGDGFRDMLVVTSLPSGVARFQGHGDGTFTDIFFTPGGTLTAVVVADFDGDGIDDAAFPSFAFDAVAVMLGAPGGAFAPRRWHAGLAFQNSLAAGDLDGDGDVDLVGTASNLSGLLLFPNVLID